MKLEIRMSLAEERLEKILKSMEARKIPLDFFKRPAVSQQSGPDGDPQFAEILQVLERLAEKKHN